MKKRKNIKWILCLIIIFSIIGIIFIYGNGFEKLTGNVIKGEINDSNSFINLTKEIQLNNDLKKGLGFISVKKIDQDENILNITYNFDNSGFIGEEIVVDIWLLDENKTEVKKVQDFFPINTENIIERNIAIDIGDLKQGVYEIYFALDSESNNKVKQSIFVEKRSFITGNSILDQSGNKMIGYVVFILIIIIGIFFILRGHSKEDFEEK
jgi:hypothetical protein